MFAAGQNTQRHHSRAWHAHDHQDQIELHAHRIKFPQRQTITAHTQLARQGSTSATTAVEAVDTKEHQDTLWTTQHTLMIKYGTPRGTTQMSRNRNHSTCTRSSPDTGARKYGQHLLCSARSAFLPRNQKANTCLPTTTPRRSSLATTAMCKKPSRTHARGPLIWGSGGQQHRGSASVCTQVGLQAAYSYGLTRCGLFCRENSPLW